ncbi:steroid receptor RNA activator 1 [Trichomycterus rosablanca]|uniref:steroid receptor RNA activator 1 n=1 Tax=Trichomycterus rosablanca TaxID=2290929 RepID=UPI002F35FC74
MSDFYIKPGNQERGWNDPPQFSYGLQANAGGPKRNVLNKRVPPPQLTAPNPESQLVPPPAVSSAPPSKPVPPPAAGFTPPPKSLISSARVSDSQSCSVKTQPEPSVPENEPNLDDVQKPLFWVLAACRQSVKKQVCDDVEKRLMIFEEMWTSGRLSLPVKCRMHGLSQELSNKNWDKADEIHRGLMVDYVNEVSQWMVGIKRLIAETRNLSPELLQTGATAQSEASGDPVQLEFSPVQCGLSSD